MLLSVLILIHAFVESYSFSSTFSTKDVVPADKNRLRPPDNPDFVEPKIPAVQSNMSEHFRLRFWLYVWLNCPGFFERPISPKRSPGSICQRPNLQEIFCLLSVDLKKLYQILSLSRCRWFENDLNCKFLFMVSLKEKLLIILR